MTRLHVEPAEAIVADPASDLQIHVEAFFSDGTSRDVTDRACYELSNLNASVDPGGRVSRANFGETTLIVRYLQEQLPVPIAFTEQRGDFRWNDPPASNDVDKHVIRKTETIANQSVAVVRRFRVRASRLFGRDWPYADC